MKKNEQKYIQPKMFMSGKISENIDEMGQNDQMDLVPSEEQKLMIAAANDSVDNDSTLDFDRMDYQNDVDIDQHDSREGDRIFESDMAPEASEFMAGEKLQSVSGEFGLAGKVEKGEGEEMAAAKEIQTLLDRMKELTKIMGNTPDVQWEGGSNNALAGKVTEVKPDEVKRSESTTGAPSIKALKNPDAVSDGSASKSEGGDSQKSEKKENPFAKKDDGEKSEKKENPFAKKGESEKSEKKENPFAKKDDGDDSEKKEDDDKEELDEITSLNLGVRNKVSLNLVKEIEEDCEENILEGDEEEDDDAILESDDVDKLYESMYRTSGDVKKCLLFKQRLDVVKKANKLNEAIAKMRNRF